MRQEGRFARSGMPEAFTLLFNHPPQLPPQPPADVEDLKTTEVRNVTHERSRTKLLCTACFGRTEATVSQPSRVGPRSKRAVKITRPAKQMWHQPTQTMARVHNPYRHAQMRHSKGKKQK